MKKIQQKKHLYKVVLVLSVCSLFLFYKYLAQLFPSIIADNLIKNAGLTGLELAIMASSYYYSYSFLQIFAGIIVDRFDARIPCFLAVLIIACSIYTFAHTNNFYILCLSRICMGVGTSFATVMYMKCAATWTKPKTFGLISSLLATFTMFGAAFGSTPVAYMFEHLGWKNGLTIIADIGFVIAILAILFVSSKNNNLSNITDSEEHNIPHQAKLKDFLKILSRSNNWLLFGYTGITFAPIIVIGGLWGNPFLLAKFAISNTQASFLMCMMFIGVGIGAPIWALISAKFHARKSLMHFANLISFVAITAIIYAQVSYIYATVMFFIVGFAVGCFMISFQICREVNPLFTLGFAIAFINMSDGIFSSIIEPIIGYTLDILKTGASFSEQNYQQALVLIPICFVISSILLTFISTSSKKDKIL